MHRRIIVYNDGVTHTVDASDGVGSPEEVAYGEGWHSAANSNPYDEPALKASWEKGRATRKQKQKMNTNYRRGESRNKKFEPPRQRTVNDAEVPGWVKENIVKARKEIDRCETEVKYGNPKKHDAWTRKLSAAQAMLSSYQAEAKKFSAQDMSRDYKSEKGYVAKLVDAGTGAVLARSEPHISNGAGLKAWIQKEARELIRRGKRVKAEVVVVFFDPNLA